MSYELCRTYVLCRMYVNMYITTIISGQSSQNEALATKNAEEGAQTAIYLAASRAISKRNSGLHILPSNIVWKQQILFLFLINSLWFSHHTWLGGYYDNSKATTTSPAAVDEKLSEWLWLESERLTGVKFSIWRCVSRGILQGIGAAICFSTAILSADKDALEESDDHYCVLWPYIHVQHFYNRAILIYTILFDKRSGDFISTFAVLVSRLKGHGCDHAILTSGSWKGISASHYLDIYAQSNNFLPSLHGLWNIVVSEPQNRHPDNEVESEGNRTALLPRARGASSFDFSIQV